MKKNDIVKCIKISDGYITLPKIGQYYKILDISCILSRFNLACVPIMYEYPKSIKYAYFATEDFVKEDKIPKLIKKLYNVKE